MTSDYRLVHLDGLRGISVILVLLFHLDETLFKGGYLGVDTFFVISGYVITRTLLINKTGSTIQDIKNFFLKRLFRIWPALFFFIFFSLILYFFYGLTLNHHRNIFTSLSALIGISNLYLGYIGVDYFLLNKVNYYLHTWSLGVEEQFYIFYPFLLLLLCKKNYYLLFLSLIISLFFFTFFWEKELGGFYSPFVRFWEILVGCLLYVYFKDKFININIYFKLFLLLGFFLNIFYLSNILFLQLQIVLNIILSASLIIFFYNSKFLSNKIINHIGLMSFSIYLWHYFIIEIVEPYINFYFYKLIIILLLTYTVSYFSYFAIEKYFICKNKLLLKHYLFFYSSVFLIISFLFINININTIQLSNLNVFKNSLVYSIWDKQNEALNYNHFNKLIKNLNVNISRPNIPNDLCPNEINYKCLKLSSKNKNAVFVIGDSHANNLIEGLALSNKINNLYLGNECLHVLIVRHLLYGELRDKAFQRINNCEKFNLNLNFNEVNNFIDKYDKIFYFVTIRIPLYAEEWEIVDDNYLPVKNKESKYNQIYTNLKKHLDLINEKIEVILVEPIPTFKYGPEYCLIFKEKCIISISNFEDINKDTINILKKIESSRKNTRMINFKDNFCNDTFCSMQDKNGNFLYHDNNHLSKYGSISLLNSYKDIFD